MFNVHSFLKADANINIFQFHLQVFDLFRHQVEIGLLKMINAREIIWLDERKLKSNQETEDVVGKLCRSEVNIM